MSKSYSRRGFFRAGLGVASSLVATHSLARVCGLNTPRQGQGPFFPYPGTPEDPIREDQDPRVPIYLANDHDLTFVRGRSGRALGQVVRVRGVVTDRECNPVSGVRLIIWQASKSGRYNHQGDEERQSFTHPRTGETIYRELDPFFQYWGQTQTDGSGEYEFITIVPGFYPAQVFPGQPERNWYRPPHIHFMVSALGAPQFVTQMYFRGSGIEENDFIQELNEKDKLLSQSGLSSAEKEALIVDFRESVSGNRLEGEFNIQLRG